MWPQLQKRGGTGDAAGGGGAAGPASCRAPGRSPLIAGIQCYTGKCLCQVHSMLTSGRVPVTKRFPELFDKDESKDGYDKYLCREPELSDDARRTARHVCAVRSCRTG